MQKTYIGSIIMLLMMVASAGYAQSGDLTRAEQHSLLTEKFQTITRTEDLPESVKKEFARSSQEATFQMADPGQEFQETDVVMKEGLPFRRLVFAGLNKQYCILHYEHGGIGYGTELILFKITGNQAQYLWKGVTTRLIPNLAELRKAIRSRKYDDSLDYYL